MNRVALFALLLCAGLGTALGQNNASLAARVQVLEDKEEIRTLLLDYGRYLDARQRRVR